MTGPVGPAEGAEKVNIQPPNSTSRRPPSNTERLDAIADRVLHSAARHLRDRPEQLELFDRLPMKVKQ